MQPVSHLVRRKGRLPHWRLEGALYFVTFRLADAIPKPLADALKYDIEADVLAKSIRLKRDLTPQEVADVRRNHAGRAEKYLDAGHGKCWLKNAYARAIAAELLEAQAGYVLDSYIVMPNHVHALMHPHPGEELSDLLRNIKSLVSRRANPLLGRTGRLWQRESFDHIVRTPTKRDQFRQYIADNPAKAGLASWDEAKLFDIDTSNIVWPTFGTTTSQL